VLSIMDDVDDLHAQQAALDDPASLVRQVEQAFAAQGVVRDRALIEAVVAQRQRPGVAVSPVLDEGVVVTPARAFDFGWARPTTLATWQGQLNQVQRRKRGWDQAHGWFSTGAFWLWLWACLGSHSPVGHHPWLVLIGALVVGAALGKVQKRYTKQAKRMGLLDRPLKRRRAQWQASPRAQAYLDACEAVEVPLLVADGAQLDLLAATDRTRARARASVASAR